MFQVWLSSLISVSIISLASLIGILALSLRLERLKQILLYLVSFSAGTLLGNALLHLLPESIQQQGFTLEISLFVLGGITIYFIVEKFIRFRHCHQWADKKHPHPFSLMILWGDGVHNFIDGVIIGASFLANLKLGWATTLAILLHEIPQEIGDFASLLYGGFTKKKAFFFNFLSALSAFGGVLLVLSAEIFAKQSLTFLIPFAAGGFIYIATADLIPQLHKKHKIQTSLKQLLFFLLGILIMLVLK